MQAIKLTQFQRNRKPSFTARGLTLIGLMIILMIAGILGTIVVHIIRHYTIH